MTARESGAGPRTAHSGENCRGALDNSVDNAQWWRRFGVSRSNARGAARRLATTTGCAPDRGDGLRPRRSHGDAAPAIRRCAGALEALIEASVVLAIRTFGQRAEACSACGVNELETSESVLRRTVRTRGCMARSAIDRDCAPPIKTRVRSVVDVASVPTLACGVRRPIRGSGKKTTHFPARSQLALRVERRL
jgi:hypothetical protein